MELHTIVNTKSTEFAHPVIEVIENRRSSRAYSSAPIEQAKIDALFEAALGHPAA
ncbi:MAG: hypothetical protein U5K54_27720 [Cytophagales bacterium]|nr:hypothetical protein [Cytophagales bacterium]